MDKARTKKGALKKASTNLTLSKRIRAMGDLLIDALGSTSLSVLVESLIRNEYEKRNGQIQINNPFQLNEDGKVIVPSGPPMEIKSYLAEKNKINSQAADEAVKKGGDIAVDKIHKTRSSGSSSTDEPSQ